MTEVSEVKDSEVETLVCGTSIANVQLFAIIDGEMVELGMTNDSGAICLEEQLKKHRELAFEIVRKVVAIRGRSTSRPAPVAAAHVKLLDSLLGQIGFSGDLRAARSVDADD